MTARATTGVARWYDDPVDRRPALPAVPGPAVRVSADGGLTWAPDEGSLAGPTVPRARLLHRVDPPYAPPVLTIRTGADVVVAEVALVARGALDEFAAAAAPLPPSLADLAGRTAGAGRPRPPAVPHHAGGARPARHRRRPRLPALRRADRELTVPTLDLGIDAGALSQLSALPDQILTAVATAREALARADSGDGTNALGSLVAGLGDLPGQLADLPDLGPALAGLQGLRDLVPAELAASAGVAVDALGGITGLLGPLAALVTATPAP